MSQPNPSSPHAAANPHDRLLGCAALVPVCVFVLPTLYGVPVAESAGAGWSAVATLVPVLALLAQGRQARPRGLTVALALLAFGCATALLPGVTTDTFAAKRALLALTAGCAQILVGASLGPDGRRVLAAGLAASALAWVVTAGLDTLLDAERSFAGVLENTGDLSEAALGGTLVAATALKSRTTRVRRGAWTVVGAYALYVTWVPVHAGALALLVGLGCYALRCSSARRTSALLVLIVLAAAVARWSLAGTDESASERDAQSSVASAPLETGGVAFRRETWAMLPALVRDHALVGTGPGQFAARFPAYRSPAELAASTFGHTAPYSTDVEHAHNDWLQGFAEYGVLGGSLWALLLAWVMAQAWLGLRDETRGPLALAALGLCVNAFFNSPLLYGTASASVGFLCIGATLARRAEAGTRPGRVLSALCALLLFVQVPNALKFIAHGRALADLSYELTTERRGTTGHWSEDKRRSLTEALNVCPDSTVALAERASLLTALRAPQAEIIAAWRGVLARKPLHFEALLALGNQHARSRRFAAAREKYDAAWELDPAHPGLQQNRLLLALNEGIPERVAEALFDVTSPQVSLDWWLRSAAQQLLRGRPRLAQLIFARVAPERVVESGESAFAAATELEATNGLLADGLRALAHQLWAREHALANNMHAAVRSYRQSLRIARSYETAERTAASLRYEFAAALYADGARDEALETLEPAGKLDAGGLKALPRWAGEILVEAGLL